VGSWNDLWKIGFAMRNVERTQDLEWQEGAEVRMIMCFPYLEGARGMGGSERA